MIYKLQLIRYRATHLRAADEPGRLPIAHGGVGGKLGVERRALRLGAEPCIAVGDSQDRPLSAAVYRCSLGATEQVGRLGQDEVAGDARVEGGVGGPVYPDLA